MSEQYQEILKSYEVLGVEIGAPFTRVRKRYLELIKIWHPDVSIEAPEVAEMEVRRVNEAIDRIKSLSWKEIQAIKRSRHRQPRARPARPRSGPARGRWRHGKHSGREAADPRRETARIGRDFFGDLELTPRQASRGSRWRFRIATCRQCAGWGAALDALFRICDGCLGMGLERTSRGEWNLESLCGACAGKGCTYSHVCGSCGGTGEKGFRTVRCRIPPSEDSRFVAALPRHGHPGLRGGVPGDLYLRVSVT